MILVDTPVWVDHLHRGDAMLAGLLDSVAVASHPWVVGELSLANLKRRDEILSLLQALPQAVVASHSEVMTLVSGRSLHGRGLATWTRSYWPQPS